MDLLRAWVEKGENINAVESVLQITRLQEGELTTGRELLTISEMHAKGFSKYFGNIDSV